jgi:acetyl-CoA acetyltransferase
MSLFDGKAVITGIGQSEVARVVNRSGVALTAEAIVGAVGDAGLSLSDIDGIATFPGADNQDPGAAGASAAELIDALGMNVNWYLGGGETSGQLGPVINASAAVAQGLARHVVVFRTVMEGSAQRGMGRKAVVSEKTKPHHWSQWSMPYGARPPNMIAMYARRYMYEFGLKREHMGEIAINNRKNAVLNPKAVFTKPMTMEEYLSVRMIAEPFCLYDCDVPIDGATAVIVSRADAAKSLRRAPLTVESAGSAVPGRFSYDQNSPSLTSAHASAAMMWKNTDLRPSDVDVAELYDGFSFLTLIWLDAFGFCEVGGSGKFVEGGGRIALDGELPVATQGGQLSAGRLHGLGFLHEACVQLWGDGGARQVKNSPDVAVAGVGGGVFAGCMLVARRS